MELLHRHNLMDCLGSEELEAEHRREVERVFDILSETARRESLDFKCHFLEPEYTSYGAIVDRDEWAKHVDGSDNLSAAVDVYECKDGVDMIYADRPRWDLRLLPNITMRAYTGGRLEGEVEIFLSHPDNWSHYDTSQAIIDLLNFAKRSDFVDPLPFFRDYLKEVE